MRNWVLKNCVKKVHASWAVVWFASGVLIGDILALVLRIVWFENVIWLVLSVLLLIVVILISRMPMMILALVAGMLLIMNQVAPSFLMQDYLTELMGKEVVISGVVAKDPEESNGRWNLSLRDLELDVDVGLSGLLFTQVSNVVVQRSDKVTIAGELSAGFGNYAATIYRPEVKAIERPEPGDLFLKFRNFFAKGIKNYLPEKEAGLGLGYLLGQKSGVDKGFQEELRTVGLTHIIVASGAHLGVLISIARKIFGRLSRFASLLSGIILMVLFIGITGLSASMLRAGLVVGLSLVCWYFGRKIQPIRLILLVAAITLVVNPMYLIDMAWLLSFASFTGILVITPELIKLFYGKNKKPGIFGAALITSVSAAVLCTPILLYLFGTTSLISILANIMILPTIAIAMGLVFLTGVLAMVLPFLAAVISKLALVILDYQILVVEFFGDKKMFLVEMPAENPLVFLWYVPVLVVGVVVWRKKLRKMR